MVHGSSNNSVFDSIPIRETTASEGVPGMSLLNSQGPHNEHHFSKVDIFVVEPCAEQKTLERSSWSRPATCAGLRGFVNTSALSAMLGFTTELRWA